MSLSSCEKIIDSLLIYGDVCKNSYIKFSNDHISKCETELYELLIEKAITAYKNSGTQSDYEKLECIIKPVDGGISEHSGVVLLKLFSEIPVRLAKSMDIYEAANDTSYVRHHILLEANYFGGQSTVRKAIRKATVSDTTLLPFTTRLKRQLE